MASAAWIFGGGVARRFQLLLLVLQLDLGAQHVEIDADAGIARGFGVLEDEFILLEERLGVAHRRLIRERLQIQAADLQDRAAACIQSSPVGSLPGPFGGAIEKEGGRVEDLLGERELGRRGVHLDDGGNAGAVEAGNLDAAGLEAERDEVDLLGADVGHRLHVRDEDVQGGSLLAVD